MDHIALQVLHQIKVVPLQEIRALFLAPVDLTQTGAGPCCNGPVGLRIDLPLVEEILESQSLPSLNTVMRLRFGTIVRHRKIDTYILCQ